MEANRNFHRHAWSKRPSQGFALILAISLLSFIILLVLSLTVLTQSNLRNAQLEREKAQASQNARLSLSIALGELQKLAGPDTRITASAEAVAGGDETRQATETRLATGVWRSWEGSNHETTGDEIGKPIIPNYASKLVTGDTYTPNLSIGRFLGWLNSTPDDHKLTAAEPLATEPPELISKQNSVLMLSNESAEQDKDASVNLVPTEISSGTPGRYAWWIDGENAKALLQHEESLESTSFEWSARLASSANADPLVFELDDNELLNQVISRPMLDLLPSAPDLEDGETLGSRLHHDLTLYSRGLLTNAATGGWKRDLSLMVEEWDDIGTNSSPMNFFTVSPGVEFTAVKAEGRNGTSLGPGSLIYPWAAPVIDDDVAPKERPFPFRQPGPVVSWDNLRDFAIQYKYITGGSPGGQVEMPALMGNSEKNNQEDFLAWRDRVRRFPVVARMHWVFSYAAVKIDDVQYKAALDANPVFTIWNPYNVELTVTDLRLSLNNPAPFAFTFSLHEPTPRGLRVKPFDKVSLSQIQGGTLKVNIRNSGGGELTLQPGEARVFSPQSSNPVTGSNEIDLFPGFRTNGGFRYTKLDSGGKEITGKNIDRISVVVTRDGSLLGGIDASRVGIRFTVSGTTVVNGNNYTASGYYREWGQTGLADKEAMEDFDNPAEGDDPSDKLELGVLVNNPDPFLAAYVTRAAATQIPEYGKGLTRTNPLAQIAYNNKGAIQLYRWEYNPLNGNGGDGTPDDNGELGFVGVSFRADLGLSHLIMAELPVRPLLSLGELQNFDITATNYKPPFVFNVLGNSHASAFLGRDEIFDEGGLATSYDHSYVSNHLFFDDWFVSSIAPSTRPWSGEIERTLEEVYEDHLSQDVPLANSFYQPAVIVTGDRATSTATNHLNPSVPGYADIQGWRSIASELEVEGMFNVNSTSALAWAALLRSLRESKVPEVNYNGSNWSVDVTNVEAGSTPVSRTTVAGVSKENVVGNLVKLGTFSQLSDAQITALAEEIVAQVKLRGPFLSLAEFVNRQLTNDDDLAIAGPIEAALLELSEGGPSDTNPNSQFLNAYSEQSTETASSKDFPKADEGSAAYGFPGWIRQGDILRNIAPVLSVRDDTFTIRAYGQIDNPLNGQPVSRKWCEAIVQRKAEYIDRTDDKRVLPSPDTLNSTANVVFGRRFEIVSFRWLDEDEI